MLAAQHATHVANDPITNYTDGCWRALRLGSGWRRDGSRFTRCPRSRRLQVPPAADRLTAGRAVEAVSASRQLTHTGSHKGLEACRLPPWRQRRHAQLGQPTPCALRSTPGRYPASLRASRHPPYRLRHPLLAAAFGGRYPRAARRSGGLPAAHLRQRRHMQLRRPCCLARWSSNAWSSRMQVRERQLCAAHMCMSGMRCDCMHMVAANSSTVCFCFTGALQKRRWTSPSFP